MKKLLKFIAQAKPTLMVVLWLCVFSFTLSGCVTIAKNADDIKTNNFARLEMCAQYSSEKVARYVQEKLERCREQSSSNGPLMSTDIWVETSGVI